MTTRPRRSVLYMPGANARALEKAKTLPCDAVILDLEDAVAPEAKAMARKQIVDAVTAGGFGARIKEWHDCAGPHHRLLVEGPEITLARLLGEPVGPPEESAARIPAAAATMVLRQWIARGVSDNRATRSSVASTAG